jgi:hypothetical protein
MVEKEYEMNWHYSNPIKDGEYLCCVRGNFLPIVLDWSNGKWSDWKQRSKEWKENKIHYLLYDDIDKFAVVCYIGYDEIPMPENW